jgi:hypothetical protein
MCCSIALSEKMLTRILTEHQIPFERVGVPPRGDETDPVNQVPLGAGITALISDFDALPEELRNYLLSVNDPTKVGLEPENWTTVVVREPQAAQEQPNDEA